MSSKITISSLGCWFCSLAIADDVYTLLWHMTQVNALGRQHGQELIANSSTTGVQICSFTEICTGLYCLLLTSTVIPPSSLSSVWPYCLKIEYRCAGVIPAARSQWKNNIAFLVLLLHPHQSSKLIHFICQWYHTAKKTLHFDNNISKGYNFERLEIK